MEGVLREAVHDSPLFRMRLKAMAEANFEDAVKQQETAIKTIRLLVEDGAKMAELMPRAADQVQSVFAVSPLGSGDDPVDTGLHNVIMADYQVRSGMCKQAANRLLRDLLTFRQSEVDRVREARRQYERALDRYESTMTRHALSLKRSMAAGVDAKSSGGGGGGEAGGELEQARRQYYVAMADLMAQVMSYRVNTNKFWAEKAGEYVDILREGQALLSKLFNGSVEIIAQGHQEGQSAEQEITTDPKKFKQQLAKLAEQEFDCSIAMHSRVLEKHGHLFRKRTRGIGPPWRLVYVSIEHHLFRLWTAMSTNSTNTSNNSLASPLMQDDQSVAQDGTLDVNILTCQIKLYESVERACCFEVSTPQRSFVFQAISEADLMDWLRVFENAKGAAMKPAPRSPRPPSVPADTVDVPEGIPEQLKAIAIRYNRQLVFASEHVLLDGRCGLLMATISTLHHSSTSNIEWVEVERFGLNTTTALSSTVTIHLRNRQVDATQGRVIDITFLDAKLHHQQANQFADLARLLSGPRKSVSTVEHVVDVLYKTVGSTTDGDSSDVPHSAALQTYPPDFEQPTSQEIEELLKGMPNGDVETQELDFTAHLPANVLFEALFRDPEGSLFKLLHDRLHNTQFKIQHPDPSRVTLSYMHPLNNPIIKAKETQCIEEMALKTVKPYVLYVVDVTASTPDILYGDAFLTCSRLAISFKTRASCRVQAWFGMRWSRSVLVKSIIKATAKSGYAQYATHFRQIVREEAGRRAKVEAGSDASSASGESVVDAFGGSAGSLANNANGRRVGFDYTVYIGGMCVMLIAMLFLIRQHYQTSVMRMTMPGFTPPTIQISDIIGQARLAEQALLESKYVHYLYDYLKGCHRGEGEHCRQAALEWKRMMRSHL